MGLKWKENRKEPRKLVRKDRRILEAEGLIREAEMAREGGAEATSTSGPQNLLDQVARD